MVSIYCVICAANLHFVECCYALHCGPQRNVSSLSVFIVADNLEP